MDITFEEAGKADINELIRLRIKTMIADYGGISDYEKECMEKQLPDYFNRKLGDELVAFLAKDGDKIVSVAYLHIIEMPANSTVVHGFYGNVLSVFTEPEYRCQGLCTQLMKNLLEYGKKRGLDKIDLSATKEGYSVYKKVGFTDKEHNFTDMQYKYVSGDDGSL
ncbi:MAG: GNAT family N-acetyltransferase [Eubacteriales bacterium]|nr:GNAT family N-acetyltransferase [Eubacteriales bacterium]